MIDGIEPIYQRIADAIVSEIPERWSTAKIEAVFHSDSSDYTGEYLTESGKLRGFMVTMEMGRVIREMRRKFKESSQPVWGQVSFELNSDGKFDLKWDTKTATKMVTPSGTKKNGTVARRNTDGECLNLEFAAPPFVV